MTPHFPSEEWLDMFHQALRSDPRFAAAARNWEADVLFIVEAADGGEPVAAYLDLWRGECRAARYVHPGEEVPLAKFEVRGTLQEFLRVLRGEIDPLQAVLTRKFRLKGPLGPVLRCAQAVLEFVRIARSVPTGGEVQQVLIDERSSWRDEPSEGSRPQPTA